jgi:hypothetical protein
MIGSAGLVATLALSLAALSLVAGRARTNLPAISALCGRSAR